MTFSRIYQTNAWAGIETRSGPGSHREPTRRVGAAILHLVGWVGIQSVLDVGCGEGNWMPELPGYIGVDVAPEAIEAALRAYPERDYRHWARRPPLVPATDLVIVRDVVQHLSLEEGVRLLEAVTARARWLLASTYVDGLNEDIITGEAYSPNLQAPPFSFPPPLVLIPDGYAYHAGDVIRDPGKMLGLWSLDREPPAL